jgi:hypothetical protein
VRHPESLKPLPSWLTAELRGLDEAVAVRYNPKLDRWQIMRRRTNGVPPNALTRKDIFEREWHEYVTVFTWENDDGSYRALDMRLIHALRKGDLQRRDWRVVLAEIEAEEAKSEAERLAPYADTTEAMYGELHDALNERVSMGSGGHSRKLVLRS